MTIYGENKRNQGRLKRELKVEIKIRRDKDDAWLALSATGAGDERGEAVAGRGGLIGGDGARGPRWSRRRRRDKERGTTINGSLHPCPLDLPQHVPSWCSPPGS